MKKLKWIWLKIKEVVPILFLILVWVVGFKIILIIEKSGIMKELDWFSALEKYVAGSLVALIFGIFFTWFIVRNRRPVLRLYTEPTPIPIENKKGKLNLYIQNNGKTVGKKIQLIATFYGLEDLQTYSPFDVLDSKELAKPTFKRLDEFHKAPSIQYDFKEGLIYPVRGRNTCIGKISFKPKKGAKEIKIDYEIVAENMNLFQDERIISIVFKEGQSLNGRT